MKMGLVFFVVKYKSEELIYNAVVANTIIFCLLYIGYRILLSCPSSKKRFHEILSFSH
jgi:hypothetical protein